MQVCTELMPSCPLLLLSKPNAHEDVVLGIAYMPKVSLIFSAQCCASRSVCLFIHLSVTFLYSVKMIKHIISSPSGGHFILVFP